jgi:type 1 glutamine amidotransferase
MAKRSVADRRSNLPGLKTALLWIGAGIVALVVIAATTIGPSLYRVLVGLNRYEYVPPVLPDRLHEIAILIFSKTNGFRDDEAIKAATTALIGISQRHGWSAVVTDNAAVFNPQQLARFKAVVWNNTSGDVLTTDQRASFKAYIEHGGGFVGIHGAGGDPKYRWRWYVETLIGAQFIGHPFAPQFQEATMHIEDRVNPATRGLGDAWIRRDEWYSFATNPRDLGIHVLATVDEHTYSPMMSLLFIHKDLRMGDHPIIWTHCIGAGRVFYSAIGHAPSTYGEPKHIQLLDGAIVWAAGLEGPPCDINPESAAITDSSPGLSVPHR